MIGIAATMLAGCKSSADKNSEEQSTVENPVDFTLTVVQDAFPGGGSTVLVDMLTGDTLAVATTDAPEIVFSGTAPAPTLGAVVSEGRLLGKVAIDAAEMKLTNGVPSGSKANDEYARLMSDVLLPDADPQQLYVDFIAEHPENPYSMLLFGNVYYLLNAAQIDAVIEAFPAFGEAPETQHVRSIAKAAENTAVGKDYVDFSVAQDNGKKGVKLSDYVVPGDYAIVDFWAPWCGPCRAEMPGLQALYDKYKGEGLKVVGVEVWERGGMSAPEVIERMGITYPIIYGAPDEVTNEYGIMSIPCILVIDPQGKIIARNIYGADLADFVAGLYKESK